MNYEKIIKTIKKYKIISFDVFDTIIKRNVSEPCEIFDLIERKYHLENFKKNRIDIENRKRSEKKREITLDEIYDELSGYYKSYSKEELITIEEREELDNCTLNIDIQPILKYCKENNKIIIIISDIYLKYDLMNKILEKNKISYNKMYISCEIGKSKDTGDIYKYVINDLKVTAKDILHIGDNFKSDFINARLNGIKSILINKDNLKIKHYKKMDSLDEHYLKYYINNKIPEKADYFYREGFSMMGPLLYQFCYWLHKNVIENDINRILFFSRDGLIIKKSYDLLYGKEIVTDYFYISRRASIVPSLKYCKNVNEMLDSMYLEKEVKTTKLLTNLGLEITEDLKEKALNNGIKLDDKIDVNSPEDKEKIEKLSVFYDSIIYNSNKENAALVKYLKSNVKNNKRIAIVDIGWFGNMQNSLEKIIKNENIDVKLYGYYVGMNPNNTYQDKYEMQGFLFDKNKNVEQFEMERRYNSVFEIMFTNSSPSLKKYEVRNQKVSFVFKKADNSDKEKMIEDFQQGALDFISKVTHDSNIKNICWDSINLLKILNDFGCNPSLEDATRWGNMNFDTGSSENYIAKPYINKWDFLFIYKTISNLKKSYWKIGYLKRALKININYNRLYDLLKKGK